MAPRTTSTTPMTETSPSAPVIDKPAIDPKFVNLQVVYSPANRPGEFSSHEGPMRFPVFNDNDGSTDLAVTSARSLESPTLVPGVPVPITLWWHQNLMEKSEWYRKSMDTGVIQVIHVLPDLERPTDSSMDFDEAGAIRIASITEDESWLDKSTADPRPTVMQAIQVAKARVRDTEKKIATAASR